ncbi:MAG TPA: sulfite exporter TauE/SafE family protein [Bacteroidia bacterium]
MEYVGYILFIVIGFILGLIGGGGSILGVPVLVYVLHYSAEVATGYSLFIVGITALIGAFAFLKKGDVSLEAMLQFAIPSLLTVYSVRKFVIPKLPDVFFSIGDFAVSRHLVIMLVFATLMLFSALSMIRKGKNIALKNLMWDEFYKMPFRFPAIVLLGVVVGFLSGFVGAGGGFLIIPVLVLFARVPMKKAIGTSLCIIAINSLIGFTGNIGSMQIDWKFLLIVSFMSIIGIIIGTYTGTFISGKKLKPAFGYFTLVVGTFIVIKELLIKN